MTKKIHFFNLDILRFLAAFMVVIGHAYEGWCNWFIKPLSPAPSISDGYDKTFITNLGLGVDVFFLISGFLITYLLLIEKEERGTIALVKFYLRRGLRIWPLYFLLIGITPILLLFIKGEKPDYIYNLLFINNFHVIETGHWTYPFAHFWSICVEEHFYLLWPIIIAFTSKKKMLLTFLLCITISILFRCYVVYENLGWLYLYAHTLSRVDVMVIGGLIAYIHYVKPIVISIPKYVRLILYTIFFLSLFIEPYNHWDGLFSAALKKYFYVGCIAFGFCNYLFNKDAFFNFTNKNSLHYLGKISYGIYMFSNILILGAVFIERRLMHTPIHNLFIFLVINIILTITVSIISYELFEKFILRFKTRFEIVKTER